MFKKLLVILALLNCVFSASAQTLPKMWQSGNFYNTDLDAVCTDVGKKAAEDAKWEFVSAFGKVVDSNPKLSHL
ncbi:hypothetical protein ACFIQG_10480 [Comamonas odontotermitis]|uniref:hypothetical protein n=1 Tax=Comamonas odontotermitis TaxID=379895 RepID=UPI003673625D